MRLAALDLGTNSFHLVIADLRADGSFHVMESDKEIVRLGETGKDMKSLTPEAMDRGIVALRRFKAIIASRKAHVVKAVATSAVREAENRDLFIRRARVEAGIEIDVISGYEEGRLIYLGALQALPLFNQRVLVLDIGGGSAEYVIGEQGDVRWVNSLKLGAIRLSHQFNLLAQPTAKEISDCKKHIAGELGLSSRAIKRVGFKTAVGTSGTIQAIATMIAMARAGAVRGQPLRLNNFKFSFDEVVQIVDRLLAVPSIEARSRIAGLDPKRADIIIGGALVLQESMRALGIDHMVVSSFALREGVLHDQIRKRLVGDKKDVTQLHDIRERSVRQLGERTNYDREHADQVARLALIFFDKTRRIHRLPIESRSYLYYAALLHDIGYYISHSEHHKHSYYIVSHAELLGFTNEEIEIIANVARYHRKSHPKLKHEGFQKLTSDDHRATVRALAGLLRIADGLDRGHLGLVQDLAVTLMRGTIEISVRPKRGAARSLELEIWGAERKKQLFEEVFGRQVNLKDMSRRKLPLLSLNGHSAVRAEKSTLAKRSAKKGVSSRATPSRGTRRGVQLSSRRSGA